MKAMNLIFVSSEKKVLLYIKYLGLYFKKNTDLKLAIFGKRHHLSQELHVSTERKWEHYSF